MPTTRAQAALARAKAQDERTYGKTSASSTLTKTISKATDRAQVPPEKRYPGFRYNAAEESWERGDDTYAEYNGDGNGLINVQDD
jgi:hypothetical protein